MPRWDPWDPGRFAGEHSRLQMKSTRGGAGLLPSLEQGAALFGARHGHCRVLSSSVPPLTPCQGTPVASPDTAQSPLGTEVPLEWDCCLQASSFSRGRRSDAQAFRNCWIRNGSRASCLALPAPSASILSFPLTGLMPASTPHSLIPTNGQSYSFKCFLIPNTQNPGQAERSSNNGHTMAAPMLLRWPGAEAGQNLQPLENRRPRPPGRSRQNYGVTARPPGPLGTRRPQRAVSQGPPLALLPMLRGRWVPREAGLGDESKGPGAVAASARAPLPPARSVHGVRQEVAGLWEATGGGVATRGG